jgi:protein-disulfide isomerase
MSKEARIRARELREARARAARRRRNQIRLFTAIGGVVIVGLLAAIITVVINSASRGNKPAVAASGPLVNPANLGSTGAMLVGQATAPVTLEVYLDYMCPACGRFEKANSAEIDRLVKAGTVRLEPRPIAFLDEQSQGTRYSTRAANAVATVVDKAPGSVWAFTTALYDHQPEEGSRGLTSDQIADIARNVGISQDVVGGFEAGTFEPWVAKVTNDAFAAGVKGTPTVKINGKVFSGDAYSTGPLTQAIEAAANAGGAE